MDNVMVNAVKGRVGLYAIFLRRLNEIKEKCRKEIIPYPYIFEKLCRNFSITKKECWEILFMINEMGLIQLVKGHGVKVLEI